MNTNEEKTNPTPTTNNKNSDKEIFNVRTRMGSKVQLLRLVPGAPELVFIRSISGFTTEVQIVDLEETESFFVGMEKLRNEKNNLPIKSYSKTRIVEEKEPTTHTEIANTAIEVKNENPLEVAPIKTENVEKQSEPQVSPPSPPIENLQTPTPTTTNANKNKPNTVAELAALFGGQTQLGQAAGKGQATARYWVVNNQLPDKYRETIKTAAQNLNLELDITNIPN
jgi:hypothetical protein